MGPEEVEAVLETIWDLHDKVSDAIHALSRAHFLRAARRRRASAAGGSNPAGLVYVKGGGLAAVGVGGGGGEEAAAAAALADLAEEARSLHAIRAALEDLEDQFECFLVSLLPGFGFPPLTTGISRHVLFGTFGLAIYAG
jgi:hypothetical protein